MKRNYISLAVLSLSLCTLAIAAEYNSPKLGFKEVSPATTEMKTVGFNEDYKVEGAVKTDRQIASEQEVSDHREPSSVVAKEKKAPVVEEIKVDEKFDPKPWLFRNKHDAGY